MPSPIETIQAVRDAMRTLHVSESMLFSIAIHQHSHDVKVHIYTLPSLAEVARDNPTVWVLIHRPRSRFTWSLYTNRGQGFSLDIHLHIPVERVSLDAWEPLLLAVLTDPKHFDDIARAKGTTCLELNVE